MINVLVVDDHAVVRRGIIDILEVRYDWVIGRSLQLENLASTRSVDGRLGLQVCCDPFCCFLASMYAKRDTDSVISVSGEKQAATGRREPMNLGNSILMTDVILRH